MVEENRYAPPRAPVSDTQPGQTRQELAGRGERLGAFIIDVILLSIVTMPYMWTSNLAERAMSDQLEANDTLTLLLVTLIGYLVLNGYLLHKSGQTIGKRLIGIRIVSATDGQLVSLGKLFGARYVPIQLAGLVPFIGNFLWIADALFIFREDRRCLHDLIAGTRVVKA
ncbi:MAG TPA: RDD family protein [Steroidobacteraceae bacterium]